MDSSGTLEIAEEFFPTGELRFRYARVKAPNGQWVKQGRFSEYHQNQNLASEGDYSNDLETGVWSEFHENGKLAAKGRYKDGKELGVWKFYDADGVLETSVKYRSGEEVAE